MAEKMWSPGLHTQTLEVTKSYIVKAAHVFKSDMTDPSGDGLSYFNLLRNE